MADKKTDLSTSTGDGTTTPAPDTATDNAAADAAETVNSSGGEPAAQVAEADAHALPKAPTPPAPSYRMPDDYATESVVDKAKAWVEGNPGLAILALAGAGLVVGRLVTALVPDSEPETIVDRVEKRARELAKDAKKQGRGALKTARKDVKAARKDTASFLDDAADTIAERTKQARKAARSFAADAQETAYDAADTAREYAHDGSDRLHDLAETIADAVKSVVDDWVDRVKN